MTEQLPAYISQILIIVNTERIWEKTWKLLITLPGYSQKLTEELADNDGSGDFIFIYEKDAYLFRLMGDNQYEAENVGRPEVIIPQDCHKNWRSLRSKLEATLPEIAWIFSTGGESTTLFYEEFCDHGLDSIIQYAEQQIEDRQNDYQDNSNSLYLFHEGNSMTSRTAQMMQVLSTIIDRLIASQQYTVDDFSHLTNNLTDNQKRIRDEEEESIVALREVKQTIADTYLKQSEEPNNE